MAEKSTANHGALKCANAENVLKQFNCPPRLSECRTPSQNDCFYVSAKNSESEKSTPAKIPSLTARRSTMDSAQSAKVQRNAIHGPTNSSNLCMLRQRPASDKLKEQLDSVLQNLISEIDTFQLPETMPYTTNRDGDNEVTATRRDQEAQQVAQGSVAIGMSSRSSLTSMRSNDHWQMTMPCSQVGISSLPIDAVGKSTYTLTFGQLRESGNDDGSGNSPRVLASTEQTTATPRSSITTAADDSPAFDVPLTRWTDDGATSCSSATRKLTTPLRNAALAQLSESNCTASGSSSIDADSGHGTTHSVPISRLSIDQIATLKRVGYMNLSQLLENYCPAFKLQSSTWLFFKLMRRLRSAATPDAPTGNRDNKTDSINVFRRPKLVENKKVFGVGLEALQSTCRLPLPPSIIEMMRFLQNTEQENLGVFRKAGNRRKIAELRRLIESVELAELQQLLSDYVEVKFTPFDAADCLKQFFRELPECVFTNKLSDALIALYEHAPSTLRTEVLRNVVYLLPDVNREALKLLLSFLHRLTQSAKIHQMTTSNLAVCFAPSLFYFPKTIVLPKPSNEQESSSRPRRATGIPDMKELLKQKAAQQCLTDLITHWQQLFTVSEAELRDSSCVDHARRKESRYRSNGSPELMPRPFNSGYSCAVSDTSEFEDSDSESRQGCDPVSVAADESWSSSQQIACLAPLRYRSYTDTAHYALIVDGYLSSIMKEYRHQHARRRRGWIAAPAPHSYLINKTPLSGLAHKRMSDGHALNLWRCSVDINATPNKIFRRLILEEEQWNESTLISSQVLEIVDVNVEIVYRVERDPYVLEPIAMTSSTCDRCVLRSWRHDLTNSKNVKAIVCTSIFHPRAPPPDNSISRVHVYEHGYVIEPITERKTRVTLFSREDLRGKGSDWYTRFWPIHCCAQLDKLYRSFATVEPASNLPSVDRLRSRLTLSSHLSEADAESPSSSSQPSCSISVDRETVL